MSFAGNAPFMTAAVGGFDQHAQPGHGNQVEFRNLGVQYADPPTVGGRRRRKRASRRGGSNLGQLSHTSRAGGRRRRLTRKIRGGKPCHGGSRRRRRSMRGGSCGCTGGSDTAVNADQERLMV